MSRTLGPRMNRERTREVVDKLGLKVEKSDGHGIEIRRTLKSLRTAMSTFTSERWRLYTGGGIAGNSDAVWLASATRSTYPIRGPFWNKTQLEQALRAWRRGE